MKVSYFVLVAVSFCTDANMLMFYLYVCPVLDLIYWRDVKKTGVVFGSLLVLLLSLALFSVLSVISYLSLVTLTVTISYRVYKNIMTAVQKTGEGHPFQYVVYKSKFFCT